MQIAASRPRAIAAYPKEAAVERLNLTRPANPMIDRLMALRPGDHVHHVRYGCCKVILAQIENFNLVLQPRTGTGLATMRADFKGDTNERSDKFAEPRPIQTITNFYRRNQ